MFDQVAALLPQEKLRFNHKVTQIDADNKILHFENGDRIRYNKVNGCGCVYNVCADLLVEKLVSTLPLDMTLTWLGKEALAKRLTFSSR